MSKTGKKSFSEQPQPSSEVSESADTHAESSNSNQEPDPEVSFHPEVPSPSASTMFMPYIEGPKMNWTMDDGLYHRFLKWQLKCKTIFDCKLANLPTKQKMSEGNSLVG